MYLVELLACKHRSILPRLGGWKLQVELLLFLAFLCKMRDDPCLSILQLRPSLFLGLGEKFYRAFEGWANNLGAKEIRLSVAEQNESASRFWQRLGFLELERRPPELFGTKESIFILMSRILSPDRAFP